MHRVPSLRSDLSEDSSRLSIRESVVFSPHGSETSASASSLVTSSASGGESHSHRGRPMGIPPPDYEEPGAVRECSRRLQRARCQCAGSRSNPLNLLRRNKASRRL